MWKRTVIAVTIAPIVLALAVTGYIAFPAKENDQLIAPLRAWSVEHSINEGQNNQDFEPLAAAFQPQRYRSFCGPASIATILRAYGASSMDQLNIFPSVRSKLSTFFGGLSLSELDALATSSGLRVEVAFADALNVDTFRERLKANLAHSGDYVLVNYDRRILKQKGAGHISPIAAYDEGKDAFLVLDEAAYRYPFTWVPTQLLFDAVHTRDGDHYRGVLFVYAYKPSGRSER